MKYPVPNKLALAVSLVMSGTSAFAGLSFSDFTPLASSSGPTADESMPITFGNPVFVQRSIADRVTQLSNGIPNTGAWDMNTVNENCRGSDGCDKGRFLFTVFETGQSGVQRHDLYTGQTSTVWISPSSTSPSNHVAFDAAYWTPWGTFITAEESWSTAIGGSNSPYGRLFELKNPYTATNNADAIFVHQNVIPRTSHEGIQFDSDGNMYFIDELNGGNVYKYTSAANMGDVKAGTADYFAAGQSFVLRVGDGNTPNAVGSYEWVPFTDANGAALPGALTITDLNGVMSVDARNTTNLPVYKGTDYQRPEDLQIKKMGGNEYMYMATTTTNGTGKSAMRARTGSMTNIATAVTRIVSADCVRKIRP